MAGLDTIIGDILKEAEDAAAKVKNDAQTNADALIAKAREEAAQYTAQEAEKTAREVAEEKAKAISSADMQKKQAHLAAKQEIIAGVIAKAKDAIRSQNVGDYFAMLLRLLKSKAQGKDGMLYLSKEDGARISDGFRKEAEALGKEAGGSITIADAPANIDGGFVLTYGGIEENCSIDALFEGKMEEFQDKVAKLLFS